MRIIVSLLTVHRAIHDSGVDGPSAARSGGQICRPFVLGFGNSFVFIARQHI